MARAGQLKGDLNGFWKGGRSVASNGYVLVRVGSSHHLADVRGYAYEHRLVAEGKIGRRLLPSEVVHHIDGNKQNNEPDNLAVLSREEHRAEHRTADRGLRLPGAPNPTVRCACGCASVFSRYDEAGRPRAFVSGHNPHISPTVDAIITVLREGEMHREALAERVATTQRAVATCLSKLKSSGLVTSDGRGTWRLT